MAFGAFGRPAALQGLGRTLRKWRLRAGIGQLLLGSMCGASKSAVCRWESGSRIPSLKYARRLSSALSLDHDEELELEELLSEASMDDLFPSRAGPFQEALEAVTRGMTACQIAAACGLSRQTVSRYMSGVSAPSRNFAERMASGLGLDGLAARQFVDAAVYDRAGRKPGALKEGEDNGEHRIERPG